MKSVSRIGLMILVLSSACSTRLPDACPPGPPITTTAEILELSEPRRREVAAVNCRWALSCRDYSTRGERRACQGDD